MSIKENSVVKVVSNDPFFRGLSGTGKVIRLYEAMGIAIVRFDNDQVVKIPVDLLEEIELKNENQEPKIPEGAERITKDEVVKYLFDVTTPDNIVDKVGSEKGTVVDISAFIGCMKLLERLFKYTEAIVITRDQLIYEIVDMIFSDGADNA